MAIWVSVKCRTCLSVTRAKCAFERNHYNVLIKAHENICNSGLRILYIIMGSCLQKEFDLCYRKIILLTSLLEVFGGMTEKFRNMTPRLLIVFTIIRNRSFGMHIHVLAASRSGLRVFMYYY